MNFYKAAVLGNLKGKGLLPFAFLCFITLLAISGCAATQELQGARDPKELYDKGTLAYQGQRYEEAETAFKTLLNEHPLSRYSVEAQISLADVYYVQEKYEDAVSYYTNFAALHPTHPKAAYSMFQKGMCHFKEVLSIDRDQSATRKALFAFEDLRLAYPGSSYTTKAIELTGFLKKRLAEREFYVARFYYKNKNYKGALSRFRDLLKNYPEAGFTDTALYYIGESYMKLGEKKLADDAFSTIISNFPESPYVKGAIDRLKES